MNHRVYINACTCLCDWQEILVSEHQHDCCNCSCGQVHTDGGCSSYIKRGVSDPDLAPYVKDLTLWDNFMYLPEGIGWHKRTVLLFAIYLRHKFKRPPRKLEVRAAMMNPDNYIESDSAAVLEAYARKGEELTPVELREQAQRFFAYYGDSPENL